MSVFLTIIPSTFEDICAWYEGIARLHYILHSLGISGASLIKALAMVNMCELTYYLTAKHRGAGRPEYILLMPLLCY